jgi:hypothetical protein
VTHVYVDVAAAAVDGSTGVSDEDAVRALGYLVELGHAVTVVSPDPTVIPPEIRELGAVAAVIPSRPDGRAWYLTSNVDNCHGMTARVRTVLVGATPSLGSVRRCDIVARDLRAAVMEILASEALQPSTRGTL